MPQEICSVRGHGIVASSNHPSMTTVSQKIFHSYIALGPAESTPLETTLALYYVPWQWLLCARFNALNLSVLPDRHRAVPISIPSLQAGHARGLLISQKRRYCCTCHTRNIEIEMGLEMGLYKGYLYSSQFSNPYPYFGL
jgi:hypothetical protein